MRTKNAVDNVLGGGVDVDLTVKELQAEQEQEAGEKSDSKKSKPSKTAKKAEKPKKRVRKEVTARDFKDLEAKGGDDELIIY